MGKKKKGNTNDQATETPAAAPEAQAADANGPVLQVDEKAGSKVEAGEHVAASPPADLDGDMGLQVVATEPGDDRRSPVSVLEEGSDGQATQAAGDGAPDPAAPRTGDPDGQGDGAAAAPAGGDLEGDGGAEQDAGAADEAVDERDYAEIGRHFMAGFDIIVAAEGSFKDYTPADNPAELLTDLWEAYQEAEAEVEERSLVAESMPAEWRVATAWGAASVAFGMPSHKFVATDGAWLGGDGESETMNTRCEAAAAYLRAYPGAMPETVVIHLRRQGFKDVPDANGRAGVAWSVFIAALAGLDGLAAQEERERQAAEAAKASADATAAFAAERKQGGAFELSKGGPFEARGPFDPR